MFLTRSQKYDCHECQATNLFSSAGVSEDRPRAFWSDLPMLSFRSLELGFAGELPTLRAGILNWRHKLVHDLKTIASITTTWSEK